MLPDDGRPATHAASVSRALPRTVVVLGLVSLLNDASSEMITPLLPIFLTATLGAGPAIVGLVEGLAEATSSVLKLVAGRLADRGVDAKSLVVAGYGLSNATRPLIGLAAAWSSVLLLRFLDRVGKGFRTAPRDALIAGATHAADRGRAFGFHRSMDHAGAVIGPLLAFALLSMQVDLKHVFLASVVPGLLVLLLLTFGLPRGQPFVAPPRASFSWRSLHGRLRAMILAAGWLALASVPEAFVVLWAVSAGLAVHWVPLVWAAASLAKMVIAMPAGIVSDRLGRIPVLLGGWTLRVLVVAVAGGTACAAGLASVAAVHCLRRHAGRDRACGALGHRRSRRRHTSVARPMACTTWRAACWCCRVPCSSARSGSASVRARRSPRLRS